MQAGGSDQWGNITAGIDLARRMRGVQLYGLTWPLLTKSDGTKMGKTESGAVWLSARAHQSLRSFTSTGSTSTTPTRGRACGCLPSWARDEIESLDAARTADPAKRDSQRRLAEELTRLVHGDEGLAVAQRATEIFFGAEIDRLDDAQLSQIFADVPSKQLAKATLDGGLSIVDALCEAGLAASKGEARRTVTQGGAYVNNRRIESADRSLTPADLASETVMVLRSGKKKYALLRFG